MLRFSRLNNGGGRSRGTTTCSVASSCSFSLLSQKSIASRRRNCPPRGQTVSLRSLVLTRRRRSTLTTMASSSSSDPSTTRHVWAFDFDGVVCDSVGESAISAWEASAQLWPELFADPAVSSRRDEILRKMRLVRPVVETGYENLVQVRCLLEEQVKEGEGEGDGDDNSVVVREMLRSWTSEMLPAAMKKWNLDRSDLVERFGTYRDEWMRRDLRSWLESNAIYGGGVADAVAHARDRHEGCYIVTTKQARFALALLREIGRIPFEESKVFSQTVSGRPKGEVLKVLQEKHERRGNGDESGSGPVRFHFVEDKLSTLEKVAKDETLKEWRLYLVDWGYNTEEERERARKNPRIEVIGVERFRELVLV